MQIIRISFNYVFRSKKLKFEYFKSINHTFSQFSIQVLKINKTIPTKIITFQVDDNQLFSLIKIINDKYLEIENVYLHTFGLRSKSNIKFQMWINR